MMILNMVALMGAMTLFNGIANAAGVGAGALLKYRSEDAPAILTSTSPALWDTPATFTVHAPHLSAPSAHPTVMPCIPFHRGNNDCSSVADQITEHNADQTTADEGTTSLRASTEDYVSTNTISTSATFMTSVVGTAVRDQASPVPTKGLSAPLPWIGPGRRDDPGYNYGDNSEGAPNGYGQVFQQSVSAVTLSTMYTTVETVTITLASHTPAETTYTGLVSIWSMTVVGEDSDTTAPTTNKDATQTVGATATATDVSLASGMSPSAVPSTSAPLPTTTPPADASNDSSTTFVVATESLSVAASDTATSQPTSTESTAGVAPTSVQRVIGMLAGVAGAMIMVF